MGILNAVVCVSGDGMDGPFNYIVYGNRSTSDLYGGTVVEENTPLTIANGATLTIPSGHELEVNDFTYFKNNGTIVNNGTVILSGAAAENADAQTVKSLKLTGDTGKVVLGDVDRDGNVTVRETYTNGGVKQLEAAGTDGVLNLSTAKPTEEQNAETWAKYGYKWEGVEEDENYDIIKGKLTLKEGFNAATVILPDAAVEIETQGDSTIGKLSAYVSNPADLENAQATKTALTFSGRGLLNIQQHMEFSGGPDNSLTVTENAQVQVTGGISLGAAGGINGTVTVNGALTVAQGGGASGVRTGKVKVGPKGTLKVSGDTGVFLAGMNKLGGEDFTKVFTIQPGGRFEADCTDNAIDVSIGIEGTTLADYAVKDILDIPSGYVPRGHEPQFNGGKTSLLIPGGGPFTIAQPVTPPSPGPAPEPEPEPDPEPEPVPTPDPEPSEPSRPSGGGYTGGGGNRPASSITVEPAEHGRVTSDRSSAVYSAPVTLTVQPDKGYQLESLTVTNGQGIQMMLSDLGNGKYAFTMPAGAVTVRAAFTALEEKACPSRAFSDLDVNA